MEIIVQDQSAWFFFFFNLYYYLFIYVQLFINIG